MTTVEDIRQIDLFDSLDDGALESIAAFSTIKEFADGDVILAENDGKGLVIRDLYLLMDGSVRIQKHPQGFFPLKAIDIQAIDNEVYGEIGWLLGSKPSAEVTSSGSSRMLVVNGIKLFDLCDRDTNVGYNILFRLSAILAMRLVNQTSANFAS
ncbi:MAG: cyclic nucleotide-binding domain-containing protein [Magnetococcales bacterium]|nr:cyclic nucleotide-binding domain-containing protein [Magnetococcales bacterium]